MSTPALDTAFVRSWLNGGQRCIHTSPRDECPSCLTRMIWLAGSRHGRILMLEQVIVYLRDRGDQAVDTLRDRFPI